MTYGKNIAIDQQEPFYVDVTAVPVPCDHASSSHNNNSALSHNHSRTATRSSVQNMRIHLQREKSSYKLPKDKRSHDVEQNEVKRLVEQGFTTGLAESLTLNNMSFPLRIWVVDNSGSMQMTDGHRIIPTTKKNDVRIVECTRWDEIKECVNYHAQMAALLNAPTTFRLLNDPGAAVGSQQFGVAEQLSSQHQVMQDVQTVMSTMNKTRPSGCTPLITHILEIQASVMEMSPQLLAEGKRVAIILATDGLPTDDYGVASDLTRQQFVESLRLLEGLPVWVVVRLCTDEEDVVEFYNDLDEQLELSLEVLDDFLGEGEEVYTHNPWLNYALPLHRCREMGYHDRLFDMLDERRLTKDEVRDFCALLFGGSSFDGVPDPSVDWVGFLNFVEQMLKQEKRHWNPNKKKLTPWIDLKKLNSIYGDSSAGCIVM